MKLHTLTPSEISDMNAIRWWHRIPIGYNVKGNAIYTPGEVMHGADGSDYATTRFLIPSDLAGKSVLDIGAWDGYFSFECERRGAGVVVAADVTEDQGGHWGGATSGFDFAKIALRSNVRFEAIDIQQPTVGHSFFDLVLCFGVLYHLKNPIAGINNALDCVAPGGMVIFETAGKSNRHDHSMLTKFGHVNDPTNAYYPAAGFLTDILKHRGFMVNGFFELDADRYTISAVRG